MSFGEAPSISPINGGGPEVSMNLYKSFRIVGDRIRGLAVYGERQRSMRKAPTMAEKTVWNVLKNKQLDGLKFRRQHGIGLYIVDFYCDQLKLIIEIDGGIHDTQEAKSYDRERNQYLESMGYRILHFRNIEIMNNLPSVLEKIRIDLRFWSPSIYGGARGGFI